MRIPRIYLNVALAIDDEIELDKDSHHRITQVLRLRLDDQVIIFNGNGGEYSARLCNIARRASRVHIEAFVDTDRESPLRIHLLQGLCKGERMDFALQKTTELGVASITPTITSRSTVQLDAQRIKKKHRHWGKVIISACEQSGRTLIPELRPTTELSDALQQHSCGVVLHPTAGQPIHTLEEISIELGLLAGPEGGLSLEEFELAREHGFAPIRIGPRILRTETAGIASIACLQMMWGDLRT